MFSVLDQFDMIMIYPINMLSYDISFTNISFFLMVMLFMYTSIFYLGFNQFIYPSFMEYLIENYVFLIFNFIMQQLDKKSMLYFPYLFSIFNFILFSNLLSLISGFFAVTSHFYILMFVSLSTCLGMFFTGLMFHKMNFLKIFMPQVPFLLLPLMIIMEMISYIISAFSLAISLAANMMAGHMLVHVFSSFFSNLLFTLYTKFFILYMIFFILFMNLALMLALFALEVGVSMLQAYVFTVLITMYLSDSLFFTGSH